MAADGTSPSASSVRGQLCPQFDGLLALPPPPVDRATEFSAFSAAFSSASGFCPPATDCDHLAQQQQQLFQFQHSQVQYQLPDDGIPGPFLADMPPNSSALFFGDAHRHLLAELPSGPSFLSEPLPQHFVLPPLPPPPPSSFPSSMPMMMMPTSSSSSSSTNSLVIPITQGLFANSTDVFMSTNSPQFPLQPTEEPVPTVDKVVVQQQQLRRGQQAAQRGGGTRRRTAAERGVRKSRTGGPKTIAAEGSTATCNGGINIVKEEPQHNHSQQQQHQHIALTTVEPNASSSAEGATTSAYGNDSAAPEVKQCAQCATEIRERTMLAVASRAAAGTMSMTEFFHCECLKCAECADPLEHAPKCYVRAARTYCAGCYAKNFGVSCAMCERRIAPMDWVRRAREFVYHLACFKCEHCKRQLSSNEECALDDQHRPPPAIPRLLCKQHYLELVRGEHCSPKQKAKRVRTTFGEEQLAILQDHFKVDSNPDGADLERIANLTGLSKRVTQVWFQNSRARQKKYHGHAPCRKPTIGGGGGGGGTASSSNASVDLCLLGGCRSATMTPSSAGQSPLIFGGSTGSESDGFRHLLADSSSSPPPAMNGNPPPPSTDCEVTVLCDAS